MAATTHPPDTAAPVEQRGPLVRFDRVERAVHWLNAALFAVLVVTGAALYVEPIGREFGRRELVERIHVYCGLALPVPILVALAGSWGRALKADFRRFNRWSAADRAWLGAALHRRDQRRAARAELRTGKFNAGQKLNAAFVGGTILVMLGTGAIMRYYHPWPLAWRTGATYVHDWLFVAIVVVIAGHVLFALSDADALKSMFKGTISRRWARWHAPGWLDELGESVPQRSSDQPDTPVR